MLMVMTTALVALLLSAFVLLLYELRNHRDGWLRELQDHADRVAQASLPVQDDDDLQAARQRLAELRSSTGAEAAGLYDAGGRLIAEAAVDGRRLPASLAAGPAASRSQGVELRRPVVHDGRQLGMLVLRARYDVMARLLNYASLLGVVTLASMVLAVLVAGRLQRAITDPIVAVARAARQVVQTRNFDLRVPRTTHDEVGTLVDAFNDMLGELGSQAEALAASERRKDEFLATLAHELRNPLAPIATALALLRRPDTDAATVQRLVAMMQRQLQQLVRLIDELMEVSRINTGRFALRLEELDLVEVVRGAVESVAPLLLERRHILQVSWPPPIRLRGDRLRLGQVFGNLLGNAAKYTPPGGHVRIGFEAAAHTVAVQVADDGAGIAPERQAEVFEMFSRVEPAGLGSAAGLGVGLALARQLVVLHGGQLLLRSAGLGRGSVFTVLLPRLAEAGFDEHLAKPVDVDGLLARLDERVGQRPPADRAQAGATGPARPLV